MANKHPNTKGLKSFAKGDRSVKELGKIGGKKSGKVRAEKKLLSEKYIEFLSKRHRIKDKIMDWDDLLLYAFKKNPTALVKEIREATEGTKVEIHGGLQVLKVNDLDLEVAGATDVHTDAQTG
jgi:hypothetical protein